MYVGDLQHNVMVHRLEHLSCYLPGVLALGAATLDLTPDVRELHEMAAHGLAYTCAISYADQLTGLGPDQMAMAQGTKWIDELRLWNETGRVGDAPGLTEQPVERDPSRRDYLHGWPSAYLLRPEVSFLIFIQYHRAEILTCRVYRRLRAYFTCGRQQGMLNGENAVMKSSRRLRSIPGPSLGLPAFMALTRLV